MKELTPTSIFVGLLVGIIMTAANLYLGLYAGLTVSASIPAVVLATGIYKGILRRNALYESNIVQTMASAGEALAAGIIFTVPALVIVGAWSDFKFWPTTLIATCGGLLGIIFMIPLRKVLIIDKKELTYPEGVACAQVLKASVEEDARGGFKNIILGLGYSGLVKLCSSGLAIATGSLEAATRIGRSTFGFGSESSLALLGVGYIVGLEVSALVFMGGAVIWLIAIPILSTGISNAHAMDIAWEVWATKGRYIGVGSMIVAGLWSLFSLRSSFVEAVKGILSKGSANQEQDIPKGLIIGTFLVNIVIIFFLYNSLIHHLGYSLLTTITMIAASFLFVAVSSYVVGLVGSSNNPVSGMTISALLGTSALFLVLGFKGESAIISTLGVAGVVCCAACAAGDCSQDLKTGHLIQASPRSQQIAQMLGVCVPALVIAPVLTLLHHAYGIGDGLKAPQATLFASLAKGIFGDGKLPYDMVVIGMIFGVVIIALDHTFLKQSKFRLHLMPLAVGMYLPVTLATPMFIAGIMKYFIAKKKDYKESEDNGVLISSGYVAGEALMGVIIAIFLYCNVDMSLSAPKALKDGLSIIFFIIGAAFLFKKSSKPA